MEKQIHFTFDPLAADLFKEFFADEDDHISSYVVKDYLNEGQLKSDIGVNFDQVRAEYHYKFYQLSEKQLADIPTTEKDFLQISTRMSNGDACELVIWIGNNELDVIGYYFMLHYFKKHAQNISVINISGLPFIDKNGKLFFPKRISELDKNGLSKASLLKRAITAAEIEMDMEEWKEMREINGALRVLSGHKKIRSMKMEEIDEIIRQLYNPSFRIQKNTGIINEKINGILSEKFIMAKATQLGLAGKNKSKPEEESGQAALEL